MRNWLTGERETGGGQPKERNYAKNQRDATQEKKRVVSVPQEYQETSKFDTILNLFKKQEKRNQSVDRPSQKQKEVSMSVAWPRKSTKEEKRKEYIKNKHKPSPGPKEGAQSCASPKLEENQEERTQSVAQPSQSYQRPKIASLNGKTESKIARTPQKRILSLPKQIVIKTARKNVSRGKIYSPYRVKSDKVKGVADIRAYFEAKTTRSPSFKGGGGNTKPANSPKLRTLVENHQTSTEPYHQQSTLWQPQISFTNGHRKHHQGSSTTSHSSTEHKT